MKKIPDSINVTGHNINISNFSTSWKNMIYDLAQYILDSYREENEKRYIIAIGGPSGVGKSTIASTLAYFLQDIQNNVEIINVSIDGYHYPNNFLLNNHLKKYKGRYDTFDVNKLSKDLSLFKKGELMKFPYYSRVIHEPFYEHIPVKSSRSILILEGLWLLYDKDPWKDFLKLYNKKVFVTGESSFLETNTIKRHVYGGRSEQEAKDFYLNSDYENTKKILKDIVSYDKKIQIK